MKNSNDTVGNRTLELPTCSAVSHLTFFTGTSTYILWPSGFNTIFQTLIITTSSVRE